MADPIYLVQGDTGPQIRATVTRDSAMVDISEATTKLHFRRKFTEDVLVSLTSVAGASDAENGIAIFAFSSNQLDLDAGEYEGEVEVVFNSGTRETIYETLDFVLRKDFA